MEFMKAGDRVTFSNKGRERIALAKQYPSLEGRIFKINSGFVWVDWDVVSGYYRRYELDLIQGIESESKASDAMMSEYV
jgi:hypothetical protein